MPLKSLTTSTGPQASSVTRGGTSTYELQSPSGAVTVIGVGGVIVGLSTSNIVIVKLSETLLPLVSVTTYVTTVVPTLKNESGSWLDSKLDRPHPSIPLGSIQLTLAPQTPASDVKVRSVGIPTISGSSSSSTVIWKEAVT